MFNSSPLSSQSTNFFSYIFPHLKQKLILFVIYVLPLFLLIKPWTQYLLFILGGLLGIGLLVADELFLNHYYNEPVKLGSKNNKNPSTSQPNKAIFLATRSTLFLLTFVPLAFFVITSTGSLLGIGLVMGLLLGLLHEMWQRRNKPQHFNQRFWGQVKTELPEDKIRLILILAITYFLFLNLFFLR
jgi:hypothetical protein